MIIVNKLVQLNATIPIPKYLFNKLTLLKHITKMSETRELKEKQIKKLYNVIHQNDELDQIIPFEQFKQLLISEKYEEFIQNRLTLMNTESQCINMLKILKAFEVNQELIQQITRKAATLCPKVALSLINKYKLSQNDYPEAIQAFKKDSIHYWIRHSDWQKAEDICKHDQESLQILIDFIKNKQPEIAYSMQIRNNLISDEFNRIILDNKLFNNDSFKPTEYILYDSIDYISLEDDFGISEQNIKLIENEIDLKQIDLDEIFQSQVIGLDSEASIQFNLRQNQQICLVQIACKNMIYLINIETLQNSNQLKKLFEQIFESNLQIVGQQIKGDINQLIKQLHINAQSPNLIELSQLFKALNPESHKTSLAYQAQQMYGKKLSKIEQISIWNARPLRQAQIHYAALDAYLCVDLYYKYSQSN